MENRYYKILGSSIKISSNITRDIVTLDKAYCNFILEKNIKKPSLEINICANNPNTTDINDIKIFAITPSSFDGWERSSKFWSGPKSNVKRFVRVADKIPDYIDKNLEKNVFEINLNVNLPGVNLDYLVWLQYFINLFALDYSKKTSYIIHGGALEHNNKGLILAGYSGTGKSTLTYALAKAGLTYLTDECVLMDLENFRMHPYPISPSFDKDNRHLFEEVNKSFKEDLKLYNHRDKSFLHIKKMGLNTISKPVIPELIIFPKYEPGIRPKIKPLPSHKAIEALEDNIRNFDKNKELKFSNHEAAELLVNRCKCYELVTNQLDKTVTLVKELVSG